MIIVKLIGGLGNQLFQYSAARALSLHKKTKLKFDISDYKNHPYRNYSLGYFNIIENIASDKEINKFLKPNESLVNRYLFKRNYSSDPLTEVKKNFFNTSKNTYLNGYWGFFEYFENIKDILKTELTIKNNYFNEIKEIKELISSTNSVSIHVRRGDYVNTNPDNIFFLQKIEYYKNAICEIKKYIEKPTFFVFSDDYYWVKDNFNDIENMFFVSDFISNKDFLEFELMKRCKHNIISNSTFSLWASWLNYNNEKKIIAPKIWYNDNNNQKLYEEERILKIENCIKV